MHEAYLLGANSEILAQDISFKLNKLPRNLKQVCGIKKSLVWVIILISILKITCVHNGRSLPCCESLWLHEGNLPRNVNIKKVYLYVRNVNKKLYLDQQQKGPRNDTKQDIKSSLQG